MRSPVVVWLVRSLAVIAVLVGSTGLRAEEPGTVILHGGGTVSSSLRDRLVSLAGGSKARLLVISSADPDNPTDEARLDAWRQREPESVALLHAPSRDVAESEQFAAPLRQATGVWISGGYQSRLASLYVNTPVERELTALLKRGGVVGGTSAGAAIQCQVMIVRGEVQRGFDLVPDCVIDQHFLARQREPRLWRVLTAHPRRLGIGVDEDTAAIIRGHRLSVLGDSTVSLCVAGFRDEPQRVERLKSGQSIDLQPLLSTLQQRQ